MTNVTLTLGNNNTKKVAVVGHERSGTHFLMNTLALNFGYLSKPWWNFDFELCLNFHSSGHLITYLKQVYDKPVINILKSHHPIDFFSEFLDNFANQFHIFYIYRDPRDVMVSFWKLINGLPWDEGPKKKTVGEFIRSAPSGAMMRFQKRQELTILHRWKCHIEGWVKLAEEREEKGIYLLKYEDLNNDFEETVRNIGKYVKLNISTPVRPNVNYNVIGTGKGVIGTHREFMNGEDESFINEKIGDTIKRLGY